MRTRTVRSLSIGAMLAIAAGVTVNSQLLGAEAASASASSSSTPGSSASSPVSVSVSASAAPVASAAPATVAAAAVAGSTTQFSYVAGDAATLVLDSAGGVLRIVTFAPHPGWFTVQLDQPSTTAMDVMLTSASGQVRFAASIVNGSIVTELNAGAGTAGSVPANSTASSSTPSSSTPGNTAPDDHGGDDNSGRGGGDD